MKVTARHKILGWVHVAVSGSILLAITLLFIGVATNDGEGAPTTAAYVGGFLMFFVAPFLAPSVIGGIGLLRGYRWAQILIGVYSFPLLLAFPVGTVIGAFGLWVLVFKPSPSQAAESETPSAPRAPAPPNGLVGLLLAAAGVACGFIVFIDLGFVLHRQTAPREIAALLWPAAIVLTGIVVYAAVKFKRRGANPLSAIALRAQGRRQQDEVRRDHDARLAILDADPERARYADEIRAGEYWTDEQIAYDLDPGRCETCEHLAPIEAAMRAAGLKVKYRWTRHVGAACAIDQEALAAQFPLPQSAGYSEVWGGDRSEKEYLLAYIQCREHESGIEVIPSTDIKSDTPVFPA